MVEFRELLISEVDKALEIEEECFISPWKREDFVSMVKDDDKVYIAAVLDGEIIGGACLRNIVGEGEITNVAIKNSFRGKGYSEKLIEELIEKGKQMGCTAFTLEVRISNLPAIKCYEKNGFENAGIRPNFYEHPKEDAMIMWLR